MVIHGFDMHRVFISTPGDLSFEQEICRAAISEVNEREAMPQKTLLVSIGLPHNDQIVGYRSAVADNIRQCAYYIQVFEDDWGPKNLFRKMFTLATECRDDSSLPMREVIVCLKDALRETDAEILAFRKELEDRRDVRIFRFATPDILKAQVAEVCTEWVKSILATAATDQPASGAGRHSM